MILPYSAIIMPELPNTRGTVRFLPVILVIIIPHNMEEVIEVGMVTGKDPLKTEPAKKEMHDQVKEHLDNEKKILSNVMSIRLSPDGLIIMDKDEEDENLLRLSGVYCGGIQYYDLKGVQYINNTGMAILIDLLKNLLEIGVDVQFVNVHEKIRNKIKDFGLDKIINYGDNK
jgi:ABC-type transporter Mla MlaB component